MFVEELGVRREVSEAQITDGTISWKQSFYLHEVEGSLCHETRDLSFCFCSADCRGTTGL